MTVRRRDLVRIIQTMRMLKHVWVFVSFLGLYSVIPVIVENYILGGILDFPSSLISILGLILSLVLVFRTNRAYDRWWEARTLWGKLVNVSRNTAIKFRRFADLNVEECREIHRTIAGFAYALKSHLRRSPRLSEIPGWELTKDDPDHVPAWLVDQLYHQLKSFEKQQRFSQQEVRAIDAAANEFLNVCGGCERIRNTLIAGSYRSYAIKSLGLYLLILPWGLVHDLQWIAIPVTMIIGYMMLGLETIADAVEEPFGIDLDDLNLEKLCRAIDASTGQLLDVPPLRSNS